MIIPEPKRSQMLAYEAFLRRAAELEHPFMLKGSYVTRQFFQDPTLRLPNDLDWVYMEQIRNADDATTIFNDWITRITELPEHDGVRFRSFKENAFWRLIDYCMDDDFPTTSTDLCCWVDGEEVNPLRIDISFNLPINTSIQPLQYTPLRGRSFTIPHTTPFALQVSWKLHQSLVRARFKDLFDLMHLVTHPTFNPEVLQETMQELIKECEMDYTDPARLHFLLNGDWSELFHVKQVGLVWNYWRHQKQAPYSGYVPGYPEDMAVNITDQHLLPDNLSDFIDQFKAAFRVAGFYAVDIPQLDNQSPAMKMDEFFATAQQAETTWQEKPSWIQLLKQFFTGRGK